MDLFYLTSGNYKQVLAMLRLRNQIVSSVSVWGSDFGPTWSKVR